MKVGDKVTINTGRMANKTIATIVELGETWATVARGHRTYAVRVKNLLPEGEKSKREQDREKLETAREQIRLGHVLVGATVRVVSGEHEGKVGVVKRLGYDTVYVAIEGEDSRPPRRIYPQNLQTITVPDPKATAEIHESGFQVDDVVQYIGPTHDTLDGQVLVVVGFLPDGRVAVENDEVGGWYAPPEELKIVVEQPERLIDMGLYGTTLPPIDEADYPPEIRQGDLVQLKTGQGPVMIVDKIVEDGSCYCLYWSGDAYITSYHISPTSLKLVEVK